MTDIHLFSTTPVVIDSEKFDQLAAVDRTLFVLLATEMGHGERLPAMVGLPGSTIEYIRRQKHFKTYTTDGFDDVLSLLKPLAWSVLEWLRENGPQRTTYSGLCQSLGAMFPSVRDAVVQLHEEALVDFSSKGREGIRLAITARGIAALDSRED